jgi:hypothetical protein
MAPATVYLASFKGTKPGWQGWFERLICWVTRSAYSHSVIVVQYADQQFGFGVSATGATGVAGQWADFSGPKWDLVPLHWVSDADVVNFLAQHGGEAYDVIGCVRSVLPFVSGEHPTRWFCSEVAATVAGFVQPWRYTPALMHDVALSVLRRP